MGNEKRLSVSDWLGFLVLAGVCIYLWRSDERPEDRKGAVVIEMQSFLGGGEWEPVATVHGFFDNRVAADDLIRGMNLVAETNGTLKRRYRVVAR